MMNVKTLDEQLGTGWRAELMRLLERQHEVSRQLLERCERQSACVAADKAGELLGVLEERQRLIDELSDLGAALERYRSAWPEIRPELSTSDRERIECLVREVERVVGEVSARDREDVKSIECERDRLRDSLESVNTGRRSNRAYGRPIARGVEPVTNRFTDEQG